MKWKLIVVFSVIVLIIVYFFVGNNKEDKVCFSSDCVNVKISDDSSERQRGLMFVSFLEESKGMLFVFEKNGLHGFWMKNTLIPLDIIWISEDYDVVNVETAEPCEEDPCPVYVPEKEARYVLEVNSGWANRNEIRVGDEVKFLCPKK